MWEYDSRLSADSGEAAYPSAEQLVPTTCADDLEVQSLVELTELLRGESDSQLHGSVRWDDPTMTDEF